MLISLAGGVAGIILGGLSLGIERIARIHTMFAGRRAGGRRVRRGGLAASTGIARGSGGCLRYSKAT